MTFFFFFFAALHGTAGRGCTRGSNPVGTGQSTAGRGRAGAEPDKSTAPTEAGEKKSVKKRDKPARHAAVPTCPLNGSETKYAEYRSALKNSDKKRGVPSHATQRVRTHPFEASRTDHPSIHRSQLTHPWLLLRDLRHFSGRERVQVPSPNQLGQTRPGQAGLGPTQLNRLSELALLLSLPRRQRTILHLYGHYFDFARADARRGER